MIEKIYISGAISNHDIEERKEAFRVAAEKIRAIGFEPVNPFENGLPINAPRAEHMKADIKLLLDCDFICMLDGWKESKGATLEYCVAAVCEIPIMVGLEKIINNG